MAKTFTKVFEMSRKSPSTVARKMLKRQRAMERKMSKMSLATALEMFEQLNYGTVNVVHQPNRWEHTYIVTDTDPRMLKYPIGWFFTGCYFANRHHFEVRVYMKTSDGTPWSEITNYHIK